MPDLSPSALNQSAAAPQGLPAPQTGLPPVAPVPGTMSSADLLNTLLEHAYSGGHLTSPEKYHELLQSYKDAAQNAPSALELQAMQLAQDAAGARRLSEYETANPLQAPTPFALPNRAPLQLPEVPKNVQPSPNPIASLGAGIAGLFAPAAAGLFGAEALSGAITATSRLNAANNEKYKFDLEQSLLKHEDDVARQDAQAKVKAQNTALTNAYTAEQHSANLEAAKARFEAETLDGKAGALRPFIDGDRKAKLAEAKGKAIQEEIGAAQEEEKTRVQVLERAGALVTQMESIKAREAKERQDSADRKAALDEKTRHEKQVEQDNKQWRIISNQTRLSIASGQHSDRLARIQEMATAAAARGERVGTMEHATFEMTAIKEDMDAARVALNQAKKELLAPSPNNPHPLNSAEDVIGRRKDVDYAQSQLKAAQADYTRAGNVMRHMRRSGRRPNGDYPPPNLMGNGPAVISGPGFELVPK